MVVIVLTFTTLYCFQFSLYHDLHQLCFLYMLYYPVMYYLSESKRVAVNMQGTVFVSKIEIVPIIKNLIYGCLLL